MPARLRVNLRAPRREAAVPYWSRIAVSAPSLLTMNLQSRVVLYLHQKVSASWKEDVEAVVQKKAEDEEKYQGELRSLSDAASDEALATAQKSNDK
ncbi:hypothetical protein VTI74DRAFT_7341 [Chaetomium olivicolor]